MLTVIRDSRAHLTANEVFAHAREVLPTISFATVYNSLKFLKNAGHINEVNLGGGASRYDAITHRHDHALCVRCGKLVDIDMELPAGLIERAAEYSRFRAESMEFTLRGECADCSGEGVEETSAKGWVRGYKQKQLSKFQKKNSHRGHRER